MAATDERQSLGECAEQSGWQRTQRDRVDIYRRGSAHIQVVWRGDNAISGGSRHGDHMLESYTRELATIRGWLTR